jgi:hypothetical protein
MTDETSQQVIRVYTDTAPRTAKELFRLLQMAAYVVKFISELCSFFTLNAEIL